jgi:hypothetical protein
MQTIKYKSIMKILISTILLFSIFVTVAATSSPKKLNSNNPTILVVGFEKDNLTSNYYGNDYLSKQFGVSQDSLHLFYFTSIYEKLKSINPSIYQPIYNQKNLPEFYNLYHQNTPTNSNESENRVIADMLELNNSDFLLYIKQYEVNWSGEPFNTIVHLMEYSLIDDKKNEVLNGQLFFNSESLDPIFLQKRTERKLKQLSQKIERTIK